MGALFDGYRHSAASANCYRDDIAAFIWRWGYRNWGGTNARMEMGKAAEAAVAGWLNRGATWDAFDAVADHARTLHISAMMGEATPEADYAADCAVQFCLRLHDMGLGTVQEVSPIVRTTVHDLAREINIRPDLVFPGGVVDLKATLAVPGAPRPDHVRQVSLYAAHYQMPGYLIYASPYVAPAEPAEIIPSVAKKQRKRPEPKGRAPKSRVFRISPSQHVQAVIGVLSDFWRIERFDADFTSPDAAVRHIPLNPDGFRWDEHDKGPATSKWLEVENAA